MSRDDLTRERRDGPDGRVLLLLSGPGGGVSVLMMPCEILEAGASGILTVHYLPGRAYLDGPAHANLRECPDFGGHCYPENAFRAGFTAAELVIRGHEGSAYALMEEWYEDRLDDSTET